MENNVAIIQTDRLRWLRFQNPVRVVETVRHDEVMDALREVEAEAERGRYAAGFISYEAASSFDEAFRAHDPGLLPLVWFGLFDEAEPLGELPLPEGTFEAGDWRASVSRDRYLEAIERIKEYIAAGDTYQVNYTIRLRAAFQGDPYALFHTLQRAQEARHCAFIRAGQHAVCSASPELFIERENGSLVSRPMKGTAARGMTHEADRAQASALQTSEKDRAENIMIVDMIRNDMGRVAETGTVQVCSAFDIERYPTVFQMTSTVKSVTRASFCDVIAAMFPCASITGAPKVRAMEIIKELEVTPRGLYTGAIGYLGPDKQARFNVAIRTVVINTESGRAEYGVGGGIVWDSQGEREYTECWNKTRILTMENPEFELLETMLWTPDTGYFLLDRHMRRLERSAEYFGFEMSAPEIRRGLEKLAVAFRKAQRVRLRVAGNGRFCLEAVAHTGAGSGERVPVGAAVERVDSQNRFLYHKTTHRDLYEAARSSRDDCEDVILFNERGEATESTIANIVVEMSGKMFTPPLDCGLLNGTFRQDLLESGRIQERRLCVEDLEAADKIWLINSVRKWTPARWVPRNGEGA